MSPALDDPFSSSPRARKNDVTEPRKIIDALACIIKQKPSINASGNLRCFAKVAAFDFESWQAARLHVGQRKSQRRFRSGKERKKFKCISSYKSIEKFAVFWSVGFIGLSITFWLSIKWADDEMESTKRWRKRSNGVRFSAAAAADGSACGISFSRFGRKISSGPVQDLNQQQQQPTGGSPEPSIPQHKQLEKTYI
ncbi:hypothetical protein DAPPUDRAFT_257137 [Daphnia pulex]|uniref:Uncharacterized protein n=1 Tax=Daphnia pulex TaxID=6669 RepID=E9HCW9_DAPPU|nr:hypothetical protein DAPPUDRAFT_257137 [Daphnia pulex]|eukprot:EFX70450.1 hypothetical protein DAPPUDRAFT_257137 [Daphnia pulex]